ncbi:unnamed protein product [Acanthoscelides obtectus]|uniref:Uncharacterized protein n=1 Tax=Acanthoscelides obtectus TaxID=200917 RepID=A0A9P0PF14_ACAOB|nr:unnamed protein product [Acanthoscelides obtectus]CAK1655934.1 hypothetical protein AOBTE_LOCUS19449 [Acanthoscelides obtectus]
MRDFVPRIVILFCSSIYIINIYCIPKLKVFH